MTLSLARVFLPGEIEHRRVHPRAAHRHPVDIEAEPVVEHEAPGPEHDFVAGLRDDQRLLQAFLCAFAGGDVVGCGQCR